jgi:hypothetical protein
MPGYKIGTREGWKAARDELAKLEAEHTKLGQKVTEQRRQLPWVPVENEYQFDTEDGKRTLAELLPIRLVWNVPPSFQWCPELFGRPVCGDQVQQSSRQTWSASAPIGVVAQQPSPREVSRPSLIASAAMSATTASS